MAFLLLLMLNLPNILYWSCFFIGSHTQATSLSSEGLNKNINCQKTTSLCWWTNHFAQHRVTGKGCDFRDKSLSGIMTLCTHYTYRIKWQSCLSKHHLYFVNATLKNHPFQVKNYKAAMKLYQIFRKICKSLKSNINMI